MADWTPPTPGELRHRVTIRPEGRGVPIPSPRGTGADRPATGLPGPFPGLVNGTAGPSGPFPSLIGPGTGLLGPFPADVRPLSGRERRLAESEQATTTHRIRMRDTRARIDVRQSDVVLFEGRELNVESVIRVNERGFWLEINATEINP